MHGSVPMTKTLLVADDALIIREMIKDAAREAGWEIVAEAGNGQEAIDRFIAVRPDAVTLDLVMPGFDGLHALRGIKQADAGEGARGQRPGAVQVLKAAFRLGAADFVVKPFDRQVLIRTLEQIIA